MIGVLDSGEGGMNAARYLEKRTDESIIFFPDRKNAPYGTKTEDQLKDLAESGVRTLIERGADRVLIACCTAGTVYHRLEKNIRGVSFPLIEPTAKAATDATENGRIALIATDATVASHAFEKAVMEAARISGKDCTLLSVRAQSLVGIVEDMARGIPRPDRYSVIRELLSPIGNSEADTLILGCTHFPSLEPEISEMAKRFGIRKIISSVKAGVDEFLKDRDPKENKRKKVFLAKRG